MFSHCGHLHFAVNLLPTYMYMYSQTFNPISPKSDGYQFSPHDINTQQERINKTIT